MEYHVTRSPVAGPDQRREPASFDGFIGVILVAALAWFVVFVGISVVGVAATGGQQAAYDYAIGLLQASFVVGLYGLVWLIGAFVLGCLAWVLKRTNAWGRTVVLCVLGASGTLFLIAPMALNGEGSPPLTIQIFLVGILPGLTFGRLAAWAAGRAGRSHRLVPPEVTQPNLWRIGRILVQAALVASIVLTTVFLTLLVLLLTGVVPIAAPY